MPRRRPATASASAAASEPSSPVASPPLSPSSASDTSATSTPTKTEPKTEPKIEPPQSHAASVSLGLEKDNLFDIHDADTRSPGFNAASYVLSKLPKYISSTSISSWKACQRLILTAAFCFFSFHALTIAPAYALPICWMFAGLALTAVFEIGHDCSSGLFFPNQTLNDLLGCVYLAPLLQPLQFWKHEERNLDTWSGAAWLRWKNLCITFHVSHLFVLLFAAIFFPYMIYTVGIWGLIKYWLIPFILFNWAMTEFISAGTHIDTTLKHAPKQSTWSVDWRLRAYLRFHLKVPSYQLGEAMNVFKRMYSRLSLDSSDGPQTPSYLENPAFGSLKLGYFSERMLESALQFLLLPLATVWLYCLYHAGSQMLATSNLTSDQLILSIREHLPNSASFRPSHIQKSLSTLATVCAITINATMNKCIEQASLTNLGIVSAIFVLLYVVRRARRMRPIYLVDFTTFTPPESWLVTTDKFKSIQRQMKYKQDSLEFMDRLVERTGLGDRTYFPPGTLSSPPELTLPNARSEAEAVIFGCLDQLFAATGTHPRNIDILVLNCSLFNPTPSLTAMIVNRYRMREDIQSYNLSGMGCSAGVISVHLAKDLLQIYRGSLAVVVSTENITQNWYQGNERGMLITNTLFRVGGAAILLSNKSSDRSRSKYQLQHSVRTHMGSDDASYRAVYQDVDSEGVCGVRLDQTLMKVAGEALKRNMTTLGPLILPWSEQIKFAINTIQRKILKRTLPAYVPDFTTAVQHFCIHAGGRAVIEKIQEALRLSNKHVAPSKAVLNRYGNTSSSSIWYELAYLEKKGLISQGDKLWQIAFGSGFKCNSAIWQAL